MNKFIKLSYTIINKSQINKILIHDNKYHIYLKCNYTTGYMLGWFGSLTSSSDTVEICKERHPEDYKIISDFINSI
jgi:hypothetical protein